MKPRKKNSSRNELPKVMYSPNSKKLVGVICDFSCNPRAIAGRSRALWRSTYVARMMHKATTPSIEPALSDPVLIASGNQGQSKKAAKARVSFKDGYLAGRHL